MMSEPMKFWLCFFWQNADFAQLLAEQVRTLPCELQFDVLTSCIPVESFYSSHSGIRHAQLQAYQSAIVDIAEHAVAQEQNGRALPIPVARVAMIKDPGYVPFYAESVKAFCKRFKLWTFANREPSSEFAPRHGPIPTSRLTFMFGPAPTKVEEVPDDDEESAVDLVLPGSAQAEQTPTPGSAQAKQTPTLGRTQPKQTQTAGRTQPKQTQTAGRTQFTSPKGVQPKQTPSPDESARAPDPSDPPNLPTSAQAKPSKKRATTKPRRPKRDTLTWFDDDEDEDEDNLGDGSCFDELLKRGPDPDDKHALACRNVLMAPEPGKKKRKGVSEKPTTTR